MPSSVKSRVITAISACVLVIAAILAFDLTPWIRGGYGWRWPHIPANGTLLVLTVGFYVWASFWLMQREPRPKRRWMLAYGVVMSAVLTLAVTLVRDGDLIYPLFARTASELTTAPHWAAARVDWAGGEWREWTSVMERIGGHIGTSPPGLVMFYGFLNDLLGTVPGIAETLRDPLLPLQCHNYNLLDYSAAQWASAWFGVLMPLWAGLTVIPIAGILNRVHPETDPTPALLWWPVVPGIAAFAGSWSTFYALVSAVAFYLLLVAFDQPQNNRRLVWGFMAGAAAGVATFLHFVFLPIFGLVGAYALGRWYFLERTADRMAFADLVRMGVVYSGGVLTPWVLFWLIGGEPVTAILQASFGYHLDLDRPYWFWVWFHVWDFALWVGVGFFMLIVVSVFRAFRRQDGQPPILAGALILTILIMTVSGTTQGESGRIWLFLSPFLLIAAYDGLVRLSADDGMRLRGWRWLTVSHAVLFVAMTANLAVIGSDFTRPPKSSVHESIFARQDENNRVNGTFSSVDGGVVEMGQFYLSQDDDAVAVGIDWHTLSRMDAAYWFSATLVGPDGTVSEARLWQPNEDAGKDQRFPTTCWIPGRTYFDQVRVPLPENAEAGAWWVSIAMFGDDSLPDGRLLVTLPDGSTDGQVGIGPVSVD